MTVKQCPDVTGLVPPHDLDSEAAILAASLLSANLRDIALVNVAPRHFYSDANGTIFDAIGSLRDNNRPVDVLTVVSWLRDRNKLQSVGGSSYIGQLTGLTPAVANVAEYCRTVFQKWRLRATIATCQRIAAEGYGDVGDVDEWIDGAESSLHALANDRAENDMPETAQEILRRVFAELESGTRAAGIPTGIPCLDRIMGPMKPGQMITIGAHSGIGKTSLALGFAVDVAQLARENKQIGVAMFSLEMSREELAERALFTAAQIDSSKLMNKGWISQDEWRVLTEVARVVGLPNLWIDDRGGVNALQVRAKARRIQIEAKRQGTPLGLVVVDYAQLVKGSSGKKNESREQEVADVSRGMKALAKELGIPIIVLAQLNEDSRKEKRRPRGSDLRESKALYHDSDKVLLIHNEAANARSAAIRNGEDMPEMLAAEPADIIVEKNRGGRSGTVQIHFWPSITKFGEAHHGSEYQ